MSDKMMSLFEYLGKPAGTDLGKKVYVAARAKNVSHSQREVSTRTYTGMVMVYPESFLSEYFKGKADEHKAKELTEVGLPPIDDSTPF
jgi:hypothetical protein